MSAPTEVRVPDLGDFENVEVIEMHVAVGDTIAINDPLVTLETDKAAMDVPSPVAGRVVELRVVLGDRVSKDSPLLLLEGSAAQDAPAAAAAEPAATAGTAGSVAAAKTPAQSTTAPSSPAPSTTAMSSYDGPVDQEVDLLVLGAGPGGYTAAFRAADLGREVALVERYPTLGGVCLNVGCIPSKALLHAAKVIDEASEMRAAGIDFGKPTIDTGALCAWKDKVVGKLTGGLKGLAAKRKVAVLQGHGRFVSPHHLLLSEHAGGEGKVISFRQCIIAAGSQAIKLPFIPHDDPRVLDSTSALQLENLPKRMLVIGGGIIGLELATVYAALGVAITVVELTDTLMPGTDRDLVRPLQKRIAKQYEKLLLGTKVQSVQARDAGLEVGFEGKDGPFSDTFGSVLVAVGRRPNGDRIDAEAAGVAVNERGFIPVDKQQKTNVAHIYAIGDIVGQPMLAHKATHEAKVAAEAACDMKSFFDARVIPSVAYTDPEVAWVGVTEEQAKAQGKATGKGVFPWAASGRSLALGRDEGFTKVLFDSDSSRVIGAGIVGPNAGELIAEVALAIEMGCDAEDLALTVHPHPTLSESVGLAAEVFEGTVTDIYAPRRKG